MVAGVSPTKQYLGYLYNVLCANHMLSTLSPRGSFDFVVFVMMDSTHEEPWTALPTQDKAMLERAGIKVQYVEPYFGEPSFYTLIMTKLEIFSLTDYTSVVFMDSDVLPLASFADFAAAHGLRENVIWAWKVSPMHGGFLVVRPSADTYETAKSLAMKFRDEEWKFAEGWGESLKEGWINMHGKVGGRDWEFNGGHADQGLFYYLLKYVVQDVSIIYVDQVVDWVGGVETARARESAFKGDEERVKVRMDSMVDKVPYNLFYHFTGKQKPWLQEAVGGGGGVGGDGGRENALALWYDTLRTVDEMYQLAIDIDGLHNQDMRSPLGYFSTSKAIDKAKVG